MTLLDYRLQQTARANAIGAALVFLNLLKGRADSIADLRLAHAQEGRRWRIMSGGYSRPRREKVHEFPQAPQSSSWIVAIRVPHPGCRSLNQKDHSVLAATCWKMNDGARVRPTCREADGTVRITRI